MFRVLGMYNFEHYTKLIFFLGNLGLGKKIKQFTESARRPKRVGFCDFVGVAISPISEKPTVKRYSLQNTTDRQHRFGLWCSLVAQAYFCAFINLVDPIQS